VRVNLTDQIVIGCHDDLLLFLPGIRAQDHTELAVQWVM
jgi:hypothetical protein